MFINSCHKIVYPIRIYVRGTGEIELLLACASPRNKNQIADLFSNFESKSKHIEVEEFSRFFNYFEIEHSAYFFSILSINESGFRFLFILLSFFGI